MFGIFTHAQLYRGQFWDSFGQQLEHRGPDYIERCTFRNAPLTAGDNVILPAQFPLSSYQVQDTPQATPFIKPCDEDMKDVSKVLYVCFKCTDRIHVQ